MNMCIYMCIYIYIYIFAMARLYNFEMLSRLDTSTKVLVAEHFSSDVFVHLL